MPNPIRETADVIRSEISKVIVGQEDVVKELIVALFVGGHVLLEGVPGVGKTLLVRSLAQCIDAQFGRIQFTPDLMPSDVVGTNVYNLKTHEFELKKGPIFTDVLLADEINRTPPKTQAALLEAMQERQATIDGITHQLSPVFLVCATQNPIEYEGTYPLPEAQLDRFIMRIVVTYPGTEQEKEVLRRFQITPGARSDPLRRIGRAISRDDLIRLKKEVNEVRVEEKVLDYVVNIAAATRQVRGVILGASPRAALSLLHCSKGLAAIEGFDFITPDHVKKMAYPVLRHRILLTPEAEVEGHSVEHVISQVLSSLTVPR